MPLLAFASKTFSFLVILGKELFEEVLCYFGCFLHVKTEPKLIYYFDCTNASNENCVEFCMK